MGRRVLVTGCRGQLGTDLVAHFRGRCDVIGVDIDEFDITDARATVEAIDRIKPTVVLHAAAYTDVDGCESNCELAMRVNSQGAGNMALACRKAGARMILFSTDYVFSGSQGTAYCEVDPVEPGTVYGQSKLEAERAVARMVDNHAIMRIAWLYGIHGSNFVKAMLRLGGAQLRAGGTAEPLPVVDDQIGNPTWTMEVARQTEVLVERPLTGVYHATAGGECSWYGFATKIFEVMKLPVRLEPCTSAQFPRPAVRPAMSSLRNQRLQQAGCDVMQTWLAALEQFLARHGKALIDEVQY